MGSFLFAAQPIILPAAQEACRGPSQAAEGHLQGALGAGEARLGACLSEGGKGQQRRGGGQVRRTNLIEVKCEVRCSSRLELLQPCGTRDLRAWHAHQASYASCAEAAPCRAAASLAGGRASAERQGRAGRGEEAHGMEACRACSGPRTSCMQQRTDCCQAFAA